MWNDIYVIVYGLFYALVSENYENPDIGYFSHMYKQCIPCCFPLPYAAWVRGYHIPHRQSTPPLIPTLIHTTKADEIRKILNYKDASRAGWMAVSRATKVYFSSDVLQNSSLTSDHGQLKVLMTKIEDVIGQYYWGKVRNTNEVWSTHSYYQKMQSLRIPSNSSYLMEENTLMYLCMNYAWPYNQVTVVLATVCVGLMLFFISLLVFCLSSMCLCFVGRGMTSLPGGCYYGISLVYYHHFSFPISRFLLPLQSLRRVPHCTVLFSMANSKRPQESN